MPGDVQAQFAEAGVDAEVVFDWDGSIQTALDLASDGLLVIDGEGRLAGQAQAGALDTAAQATVTETLDRIPGRVGASVTPSVPPSVAP